MMDEKIVNDWLAAFREGQKQVGCNCDCNIEVVFSQEDPEEFTMYAHHDWKCKLVRVRHAACN